MTIEWLHLIYNILIIDTVEWLHLIYNILIIDDSGNVQSLNNTCWTSNAFFLIWFFIRNTNFDRVQLKSYWIYHYKSWS